MKSEFSYNYYIKNVLAGKITTCEFIKQAIARHQADLLRSDKKSFPYCFDEDKAKRAIKFIQQLKHTKGELAKQGQRFLMEPWEQWIVASIFGWVRKDNGMRRFRRVFIEIARKNGKTILAAAIVIAVMFLDKEEGAEAYCTATKKDQAKIAWDQIDRMISKNAFLSKITRTYKQSSTIVIYPTSSKIMPLAADSDTEDGLNPYVMIADEYHAAKTNELLEVVESGMGSRSQPLTLIITSAGTNKKGPCYTEERDLSIRVLSGKEKNEQMFCALYELDDPEKEWMDPKCWIKAIPNLGVSVKPDWVQARVNEALAVPSKQVLVKTKQLNIWCDAVTSWISDKAWNLCAKPVTPANLKGRRCFLALDLSDKLDLTTVVAVFPPVELETDYQILPKFYMPADRIDEKTETDHVPYSMWRDQGLITCIPGDIIDQDWIENDILNLCEEYEVISCAYDPWHAGTLVNHLSDHGIDMVKFDQGIRSMAEPSAEFERMVLAGKIAHGGHPILAWNLYCTTIKTDANGNFKPLKPDRKTGKRIDGIVASIMGLALATGSEAGMSEDLMVIGE